MDEIVVTQEDLYLAADFLNMAPGPLSADDEYVCRKLCFKAKDFAEKHGEPTYRDRLYTEMMEHYARDMLYPLLR